MGLAPSGRIRLNVTGMRGPSFAAVARQSGKIGSFPVASNATDDEVFAILEQGIAQAGAAQIEPYVTAAGIEADRATGAAQSVFLTTAGFSYSTLAEGAAAVDEGQGYIVVTDTGRVQVARKVNGVGVIGAEFLTITSFQQSGVYLLSYPGIHADGVTGDTAAIRSADALARAFGVPLIWPGKSRTIVADGDFVTYGTFDSPNGSRPFPRGLFEAYDGMCWKGTGCTLLLSGGRHDPAGFVYQNFWDNPGQRITGARFEGIKFDGNLSNQIIESYPAGTTDLVWQHANAIGITLGDDCIIEDCEFIGMRGNDVAFLGDTNYSPGNNNKVLKCRFRGSFGIGVAIGSSQDVEVGSCKFYAADKSLWIGAISIEILGPDGFLLDHNIHDCTFDFRSTTAGNGKGPPEATLPQYATDSQEAENARLYLRRAVIFTMSRNPYPNGNAFNGHVAGLSLTRCKIYQGVVQVYNTNNVNLDYVDITNVYEDLSQATYPLLGTNALEIKTDATGIRDASVTNCNIDSALEGRAMYFRRIERLRVSGNISRNSRRAGGRVEECGGVIGENQWIDCGVPRTADELSANPDYGSGLAPYGGETGPLSIARQTVIDTRVGAARGMINGIYANLAALPVSIVDHPLCQNLIGADIVDVNNSLLTQGFDANGNWTTNRPIVTTAAITTPHITIQTASGDASIDINAPAGSRRSVSLNTVRTDGSGTVDLGTQIAALGNGSAQINIFVNGVSVGTPFTFNADGSLTGTAYWQTPFEIVPGTFLWVTTTAGASGQLRKKVGRPTSDLDGTEVAA